METCRLKAKTSNMQMFFLRINTPMFSTLKIDRCVCIKLNFVEIILTTLDTDEMGDRS